ncbi:MAG: DUF2391 domain-containing protein [Candidatus Nanosalina sp.]
MGFLEDLSESLSDTYPFGLDDFFQQVLGSIILISPFIFTEEVWRLAANMEPLNTALALVFTFSVGHGVLYRAKNERDWDQERKIFGVTLRYISLMGVAFGTIGFMILVSGAHETFNAGFPQAFNAVSLISIFSVIGAAVTDSLI